jgi:hypothetical protein
MFAAIHKSKQEGMMTTEDYLAEMNGKIDAMVHICTLLLSTHPFKKELANLVKKLPEYGRQPNESAHQESYRRGIRWAVDNVEVGLKNAQLADILRSIKPDERGH